MAMTNPSIGQWFRRPNGTLFEVVAIDEDENTVEIQLFDGTIDEIDADGWSELFVIQVAAPEDVSGSLDMDPDEDADDVPDTMPRGFHDPFGFLDGGEL
jgi:Family of unknown function (DUF6763)